MQVERGLYARQGGAVTNFARALSASQSEDPTTISTFSLSKTNPPKASGDIA